MQEVLKEPVELTEDELLEVAGGGNSCNSPPPCGGGCGGGAPHLTLAFAAALAVAGAISI